MMEKTKKAVNKIRNEKGNEKKGDKNNDCDTRRGKMCVCTRNKKGRRGKGEEI